MSPKKTAQPKLRVRQRLAANLVRLRSERKLSQEDLANLAHVHRTFITHVEREQRNLSLDSLEKLATALGVPESTLLE